MRLIIEGCPVSQKNRKRIRMNRRTGVRFIGSEHSILKWKGDAILQLRRQWHGRNALVGSVHAHLLICQGRGQHLDADNAMAGAFDALEKAGVVKNDYQFDRGSWERIRDRDRPRIEITLTVE